MDKNSNEFSEFVPFRKLEKLRLKSQNQKAGGLQYIWAEWAEELYKAKAIKYVITRLPVDSSIMEVATKEDEPIRIDNDTQIEATPVNEELEVELIPAKADAKIGGEASKKIANKLKSNIQAQLTNKLIKAGIKRSEALKIAEEAKEEAQLYLNDDEAFNALVNQNKQVA